MTGASRRLIAGNKKRSFERQTFDYIWFSKDLVAHVSVAAAPLALLVQRERGGQRRQLGLGRALRQVPINK